MLIPVNEAKQIIAEQIVSLSSVLIKLEDAVGYILSEDIYSDRDIPGFRQSSMDGFAIRLKDIKMQLPIQDELPAGTSKQLVLEENKCIKVFTGGPIPDGADIVIQKEWVQVHENTITIQPGFIELGAHIRMPGSDIKKGALGLKKFTLIQAMHIGYLASMGISHLPVFNKPSVGIIITGNELVQPGNVLQAGQVYESNSFALRACLLQQNIKDIKIYHVKDHADATQKMIANALDENDLILITGGVSVGDYDFVAGACIQLGVHKFFHGVKQRPGKPLFFGMKESKPVFGLPGNPASVLSCFQQYVVPAICKMTSTPAPEIRWAKLEMAFEKKPPLTLFLKAFFNGDTVQILPAQASYQLSAFVDANCWVELDEMGYIFEKDQLVKIYLFS